MSSPINEVFRIFRDSQDFRRISDVINKGIDKIQIPFTSRSIKLLLLYGLNIGLGRPVVYIASNQHQIMQFVEELRILSQMMFSSMDNIIFFPDYEGVDEPYTAAERLKFFSTIFEEGQQKKSPIIATPLKAFLRLIPSMKDADFLSVEITEGTVIPIEKLIVKLLNMGYKRTDLVMSPGEFAQRGGILDIYPPTIIRPVRLEWWGDEIEEIREFEPSSQRSLTSVDSLRIGPSREFICETSILKYGIDRIKLQLQSRVKELKKQKKFDEAEYLQEKILEKMTALADGSDYSLLMDYPHFFFDALATAFDFLPENSIICLDEPGQIKEETKTFLMGEMEMDFFRSEQGLVLPRDGNIYLDQEQFFHSLEKYQRVEIYGDSFDVQDSSAFLISSGQAERFRGQVNFLYEAVNRWLSDGQSVILLTRYAARISEMLSQKGVKVERENPGPGKVVVFKGQFPEGFTLPENKIILLTDVEIFGKGKLVAERKQKQKKIQSAFVTIGELNIGDLIVHEDYGIARYEGIERLVIENVGRDFLSLIFAKEDKLYIPVDQFYKITRYIGGGEDGGRLSRLGTAEWKKVKARTAKMVKDMADELIKLYAARKMVEGFSFPEDTEWSKQMEDSFIYEETEDQKKAINDVKKDMNSKMPMDRLICGDVGYGKTEVAIRAAFKAMEAGKQVLMLVPTTVLAQQHYNTFTDRLAPYPFKIDMLSRFKSNKEQKETIQNLSDGKVDMVIGTHRLLQKDVSVPELGLLIVDEEQRFGVSHKEKLKKMRETVDVLTLTATPIPRTLYMSLVGSRDISVIETPPEDRLPVKTYLLKRSDKVIKEAISRELARGGQIYYLHNKVENIDREAFYLTTLFPDAKIGIGHGQMDETELEQIMYDFVSGEYDILVCTTIIESGLDIPNANTLIVNHAERFGLSQLYQLRGRVGRSTKQAYAYLFYDPDKNLSETAFKRLEAISELTELGAGFQIAMKDLEIRGAGNLLGAEQHGFICQIGFELYCQLLSEAIEELKGETKKTQPPAVIEVSIDAYIPDDYIIHKRQKLVFYKRLASVMNYDELGDVIAELKDRFGKPVPPVENLIALTRLKILAMEKKVKKIKAGDHKITVDFLEVPQISKRKLKEVSESMCGRIYFNSDDQMVITKIWKTHQELLDLIEEMLVFLL